MSELARPSRVLSGIRAEVKKKAGFSGRASCFFQRALQGVLVLLGEIHHLRHFGFGHFVREHTAHAYTFLVDMEHHPRRIFHPHPEKTLETQHDEFHRRIVIIEHQHLIGCWLFGLGAGARGDAKASAFILVLAVGHHQGRLEGDSVSHCHARIWHFSTQEQGHSTAKTKTAAPVSQSGHFVLRNRADIRQRGSSLFQLQPHNDSALAA